MINYKDVTFCIKTFNRPETLKICLRHLFRYAEGNKIIVCDDSTNYVDYPKDILEKITLLRTEPNIGVARGRNLLMRVVESEYLFLTDDDQMLVRTWKDTCESIPDSWLNGLVAFPVYEKKTGYYIGGCRFEKCLTPDGYLVCVRPVDNPPYHACGTNFLISTENANKIYRDKCLMQKGEHFSWHWKLYKQFPELKIHMMPDEFLFLHYTSNERYSEDYSKYRHPNINVDEYLKSLGVHRFKWVLRHKDINMNLPDVLIDNSLPININVDKVQRVDVKNETISKKSIKLSSKDVMNLTSIYKIGFEDELKINSIQNAGLYIINSDILDKLKDRYKKS